MSGTRGSSGLGSSRREHIDSRILLVLRAGDHWSFRTSRQMEPLWLILGW